MKKILSFFIITLFVLGFSNILVNANEYLPKGDNYIQNSIAEYETEDDRTYVNIFDFIRIEPSVIYTLETISQGIELGDIKFYEYDKTKTKIGEVTFIYKSPNRASLHPTNQAKFIMGKFEYITTDELDSSLEQNFIIYKGDGDKTVTDLELSNIGYRFNHANIGNKNEGNIYTSVDNPVAFDTIKEAVRANDNVDGDVTENIITVLDTYSENMNTVGSYKVKLEVSDSSSNKAQLLINVHVKDVVSPVIRGKKSFVFEPTDNITSEDIKEKLTVTDNYYQDITLEDLYISEDTLTGNENKLGTYNLVYSVTDGSGNIGEFGIEVEIKDTIKPTITGKEIIKIGLNKTLSDEEILEGITASDSFEGDLTSSLKVTSNDHKGNENKVGTYEVEVEAKDSSGNTAYHYLNVVVEDTIPPYFYVTDMIINLETNQNLSEEKIIAVVTKRYKIDRYDNAEVVINEYEESNKGEGIHKVVVNVDGENYELIIHAHNELYEEVANNEKTTFLGRLWNEILEIINKIKVWIDQWI